MKSDRWQRVNQIFEAALEFAAEERRAFVSGACDGDASLRQEVESLLVAHNEAESFMERPAVAEVVEAVLGSEKLFKGQRVGQYKILGELGQGGQGAVYQALDTKLNRTVALKLLPPELTVNEINRKRFQREAQLASALDHPNICTIHDLTEFDGLHFIVMQFVAGRNIRELVGGHPLELTSALKVAIQVCDALAAAHAQGIIHRDIKAQNVIVTDNGQAKILDFGLAKLTQEDPEVKDQTELTVQGSPYGTPTYAAPEQSRGERVDHRADIFSTGVLLYEMLAGTGAFHGKTAVDVRHAVLHETPKPIAELRGEPIPEKLQATIDRALAKEPRERFQNIAEMRNELIAVLRELPEAETSETTRFVENFKSYVPRRIQTWNRQAKLLMAGAVLLGLILAGFLTYRFIYSDAARTSAQPVISSVAVMPFANIGGDANTEYLSDGVTETLIDSLSKLPNVAVKSRSSVFRYKGREIDPSVAGSELSVQAVLTGRLVQRGDALFLSLELVDARNNNHLWGSQYNRRLADLVTVQEEIVKDIAHYLRPTLTGAEQKDLTRHYTDNTEAYQLYLRGRYFWLRFTPADHQKAAEYFNQAIAIDPTFALAYAGLGDTYAASATNGWISPREGYPKAKVAVKRALEIDNTLAEAHNTAGALAMFYDLDWATAEREYKRAIELNPNYAITYEVYSYLLSAIGRLDEGIAMAQRGLQVDTLSVPLGNDVGGAYYLARRYDQAIKQYQESIELDSTDAVAHWNLGEVYELKGMPEAAIKELQKAIAIAGRTSGLLALLGHAYAASGKQGEAQKILGQLNKMSEQAYVSPYDLAILYIGLGDKDRAFEQLTKAYEDRTGWIIYLNVEPIFDPLRSDPRFVELVSRMKFPR